MQVLWHVCRVVFGLLVIGASVMLVYWAIVIWLHDARLVFKPVLVIAGLLVLLAGILGIDSGIGLATKKDESVRLVTADSDKPTKRLFLLFHGYNGRGENLLEVLEPYLTPYGTVVAFQPSLEGYDSRQVVRFTKQAIDTHKPDEINVYGESFGGEVLEDLLRQYPKLRLRSAVLNATPDKLTDIRLGGRLLHITRVLHGGPISTWVLRKVQAKQVGPLPGPGLNETAANRADRASLSITAPMAFAQLRYMARHTPTKFGEFTGRVETVWFIHAPGPRDDMVENEQASISKQQAYGRRCFRDVSMSRWNTGEHTPTPHRAQDVAVQILMAAGIPF